MSKYFAGFVVALGLAAGLPLAAIASQETETIVLVRHGEKPTLGLGQLNCQGLNRALALPSVIKRKFGKPDAIFAPDPAHTKSDYGHAYNYVRPLATIEPAAIAFGLPINANYGVEEIEAMMRELDRPDYRSALILVAWEHRDIVKIARLLLARHGADPVVVPDWNNGDFDSIYVVKIARDKESISTVFEQTREGLDGQPTSCPGSVPNTPP